jgi:hypothetical protein
MAEHAQEALEKLLESLRKNDAQYIAEDISRVIARGVTAELDTTGKIKELSQRPLDSGEAYILAVEMLIAFLEPAIMKEYADYVIQETLGSKSSLVWANDFVEESPVSSEDQETISIRDIASLKTLEADLGRIIDLMGRM